MKHQILSSQLSRISCQSELDESQQRYASAAKSFGDFAESRFKEISDDGSATLHTPSVVANDGVYWLSGRTILPNDLSIESVFRVNTSSGGDLLEIYWKINGEWYEHDSIQTFGALGITREQAFPFDWQFNIELENDIFHPK